MDLVLSKKLSGQKKDHGSEVHLTVNQAQRIFSFEWKSSTLFSAADWRSAPTGGCRCKKQLELFFLFSSISSKVDLKAIATGCFSNIIPLLTSCENGILLFLGQKDMINREQRSAEERRWRSCFDYDDKCGPRVRANDRGCEAFGLD
jgi:hypothetical protein